MVVKLGNFGKPIRQKTVDLKDIKAIIDLMRKNSVSEFELEKEGFKIRLKRAGSPNTAAVQYDEPAAVTSAPISPAIPAPPAPQAATLPSTNEVEIKSPMIGTFYRTPSPESASYVEVGMEVNPVRGSDVEALVARMMSTPSELAQRARDALKPQ